MSVPTGGIPSTLAGLKTLAIHPADTALVSLGWGSRTATIDLTAHYDTDVEMAYGTIAFAGLRTPFEPSSSGWWSVKVIPADHPDLVRGQGTIAVTVTAKVTPRQGCHARDAGWSKTVVVTADMPDLIYLADLPDVTDRRRAVLLEDEPGLWSPAGLTEIAPGIWG